MYRSPVTFSGQIAGFNHVRGFAGINDVSKDW